MNSTTYRARCKGCGELVEPLRDALRKLRSGPNIGSRAYVRDFVCGCGRVWCETRPAEAGEG